MERQKQAKYQQIKQNVYRRNDNKLISMGYESFQNKSIKIKKIKRSANLKDDNMYLNIEHINLLSILGLITKGDITYIVYENYSHSLREQLIFMVEKNQRFQSKQVFDIFLQIVEGIEYLHSQKIFHHNLSPSNVLVDSNKEGNTKNKNQILIKIADYAKSKDYKIAEGEKDNKLYECPYREALPQYLDLWSAGLILLELLTIQKFRQKVPFIHEYIKNKKLLESKVSNRSVPKLKFEEKQIREALGLQARGKEWALLLDMILGISNGFRTKQIDIRKIKTFMNSNRQSLRQQIQINVLQKQIDVHQKQINQLQLQQNSFTFNKPSNMLQVSKNIKNGNAESTNLKEIKVPQKQEDRYTIFFDKQEVNGAHFNCYLCEDNLKKKKLKALVLRTQSQKQRFKKQNYKSLGHFNLIKIVKIQQRYLERYRGKPIAASKSIEQQNSRKEIICYSQNYAESQFKSLHQRIYNSSGFQQIQILDIFLQLLQLFTYLSSQKRVHTCLNPKHIFINSNNQIKVDPFHTLLILQEELQFEIDLQQYSYYPPEVILKAKFQTNSNLWTIGLILYELLTKQKPYDEYQDEIWGTVDLNKFLIEKRKCIVLPKGFDNQFCKLVQSMTIYNYEERFQIIDVMQYMRKISDGLRIRLEKNQKNDREKSQKRQKKA